MSEEPTGPIRAGSVLPADREPLTLHTADGLDLVGELALPVGRPPRATLVCLHPLPTHGGMMDSHLLRKAAYRLPALADLAVLRFNTRGTASEAGTSQGEFAHGVGEAEDIAAALAEVQRRGLPHPTLVGWSFGTELALMYGSVPPVEGAVLLAPPLHRAGAADLAAWAAYGRPMLVLVPEFDDYLQPSAARSRFTAVPQATVVAVAGARHLFVGEPYVRVVLDAIVAFVAPGAGPLPTLWPAPTGAHDQVEERR